MDDTQFDASLDQLVNPFAAPVGPAAIVIFGAAGDLTKRKLIPALCNLLHDRLLSPNFCIIGVGRTALDTATWRRRVEEDIHKHKTHELPREIVEAVLARLRYVSGDFNDPAAYARLEEELQEAEKVHGTGGNRLFYLSTAPEYFSTIVKQLGAARLVREGERAGERGPAARGWRRVIVEKPFGVDLESARQLNRELRETLREDQIFRIDHYLGKETVQNILVFRFGNCMFEPIWNRRYIDNVQITVAESIGVEGRARCATWCRTTSCSSCRSWRWSRPPRSRPKRCARRRPRCSAPSRP
jgi:glucose-6-phosphate 1-dehydrogenase